MTGADRVIRWSAAGAVVGVAAVASYEHAYALVRAHGEAGWTARLVPFTVDGLICASSMVLLDAARREILVPALARWLLGVGIAAILAANVAHGLGHGLAGTAVAAWPAVALVGSCELLMMIIRGAQVPADVAAIAGLSGCPLTPIRGRCRPRSCSPMILRPVAFRRCALSAPGFISGNCVRSGRRRTWLASPPDSRPGRRSMRPSASGGPGTTGASIHGMCSAAETAGERSACRQVPVSRPIVEAAPERPSCFASVQILTLDCRSPADRALSRRVQFGAASAPGNNDAVLPRIRAEF